MAALAAVVATTAVTPDLTALGGWMSLSADPTPAERSASRAALTNRSSGVLRRNNPLLILRRIRRNGLIFILSVRRFVSGLSARCPTPA